MRRRRGVLLTLACLCVLLASAARAEACTCGGPGSPCEELGSAAAVFVGTVTDVATRPRKPFDESGGMDWAPTTVTFAVAEAFHGVSGAEAQVSTGLGGGDCGYGFERGVTYLVYAHRAAKDDARLYTGICSRTRPLAAAAEDLEFLRSLAGRPAGVTISGRVEGPGGGPGGEGPRGLTGVAGARVTVEGEGERRELLTDARGRYGVSGLAPGRYKVGVRLPDTLTTHQPEREFQVADRGCAVTDFEVAHNGRVSGRVFDAEGKPVKNLSVVVVDAEGKDPDLRYGRHERTDDEGRYKFKGLPPGRYLLGLRLAGAPQPGDPAGDYPRTYYPGVARAEEAEVIELKAGEESAGRDLRLPPRLAGAVVRVRVVWADGSPVADALVVYYEAAAGGPGPGRAERADARGELTLQAHAGAVYHIEARRDWTPGAGAGRPGRPERSAPVTLNVSAPAETVTLV
ncbi:MAG TPA: carboxypeptidase-like regulatory domain-containing protein [Pyrinomonadaceae bacterium]